MTRMTNDIESLNEMFAQGAITLIADFVKMLAILIVIARDRRVADAARGLDTAATGRARRVLARLMRASFARSACGSPR